MSHIADQEAAPSTLLLQHPLLRNLSPAHLALLAGCAVVEKHRPGSAVFRKDDVGQDLILVHRGRIAIEDGQGQERRVLQPGDSTGWFCLLAESRWPFDSRVLDDATVIRLLGACVRRKCRSEAALGYDLAQRILSEVLTEEMSSARGLSSKDVPA